MSLLKFGFTLGKNTKHVRSDTDAGFTDDEEHHVRSDTDAGFLKS